jgi:hypothetical protein
MAPTHISLFAYKGSSGKLAVHLQTADTGTATQTRFELTNWNYQISTGITTRTYADYSYTDNSFPDLFGYAGTPGSDGDQGPAVAFDQWHHLLLSWDLGSRNASHGAPGGADPASSVDESSKMYCAIDGQDQSGNNLPAFNLGDPNAMVSYLTYQTAGSPMEPGSGDSTPTNIVVGGATEPPSYEVIFNNGIQADGIFIPAEPQYARGTGPEGAANVAGTSIRPIYRIELAELYIFEGRVFTSDQVHIFMGGGIPTDARGIIQNYQPTIARAGSSNNWLSGDNTGQLVGDFSRVGTITPYSGPRLGT